ncbi:MAG: helix-turn-helix transcriptional regulator [Flavobacteriaceae bacterium]|nr:helix-turn-helix transcriptional regulator [Flavobacteriaceae bacterium]
MEKITEFKINTDTWFVFSIFFISTLALFIFLYVAIPYFTRKKHLNRLKYRQKIKHDNYKRLEKKYSERKIANLQENNQKLQIDLKNDLQQILKSNLKTPNFLSFFSNFEKIYPTFDTSIEKITPDITANELKLCALLRLNLSSKEISLLLNITPDSVNKARYRLRKKMELNSKEDLFIFLSSI